MKSPEEGIDRGMLGEQRRGRRYHPAPVTVDAASLQLLASVPPANRASTHSSMADLYLPWAFAFACHST
jgi:hypothetical protein